MGTYLSPPRYYALGQVDLRGAQVEYRKMTATRLIVGARDHNFGPTTSTTASHPKAPS